MKNFLMPFLFFVLSASLFAGNTKNETELKQQAAQLMQNQPVTFLENKGQMTDMAGKPVPFVLYALAAQNGLRLFLTEQGLTYVYLKYNEVEIAEEKLNKDTINHNQKEYGLEWNRIDMSLKGAQIKKENIIKEGKSKDFSQYFLSHCPDGITDVYAYEKLTIKNIYPGIDWVLYNSTKKGFKYDFVVHPGADPKQIELVYASLNPLSLNKDGSLQMQAALGNLKENAPYSYIKGSGRDNSDLAIHSRFKINTTTLSKGGFETTVSFFIDNNYPYTNATLVIDPQLEWGTFYGPQDGGGSSRGICTDTDGNVFVTGFVGPTTVGGPCDFPVYNPGGGAYFQGTVGGNRPPDIIILKFNNKGVRLWATYYGGSDQDYGNGICTDAMGNVFITGRTSSSSFPLYNPGGGAYVQGATGFVAGAFYAVILKFSNIGQRLWATYYGPGGFTGVSGDAICTDPFQNIFVTGYSFHNSGLGSTMDTYNPLGGAYYQSANANVAGATNDAIILKFSNTGQRLWATYFGGTEKEEGNSVCTDVTGNVYIIGSTTSSNLPLVDPGAGAYFDNTLGGFAAWWGGVNDVYIAKFSNTGQQLWTTFYGGNFIDNAASIGADLNSNIFVIGTTMSGDFPVLNAGVASYFQATGVGYNGFISKFNSTGKQLWSTYYGGSANDFSYSGNLAIDGCNNVYVSFLTESTNAPVQNSCAPGYYDSTYDGNSDYLISKFSNAGVPLWGTYLGGDGKEGFDAMQLATDQSGNLFCTGTVSTVISTATYPLKDPGAGAYFEGTYRGTKGNLFITKFTPSPSPFTINSTVTSAGCNCSGTALADVSGGCGFNKFSWYDTAWTIVSDSQFVGGLCMGNYQVIVTDTVNCGIKDTAVISIVNGNNPINISLSPTICAGDSTILTASGGGTYSWSTAETTTTVTVSPTITTTYTVTVINGTCTGATTVVVTVNQNPIISVSPTAICAGGTSTLTATGGTSYLWSTTETTSTITVSPPITTSYSLTATTAGCNTTASATVIVGAAIVPVITGDTIICNGSSTTLTTAGGTYLWSTTETTSAITVSPTITTTYTVMVTDGSCSGSVSQTVTVNPIPTPSIAGITTICTGSSTILTASGGDTYNWSTTEITTAITVSPISNTTYTVIATSLGCTGATTVAVTVNALPTPNITGTTAICTGNSTILTANSGGMYEWSTTETTTAITVSPTTNTTYTVTATTTGCTGTTTIVVSIVSPPTAIAAGATVCEGETVNLTSTGGGAYTWNGPNAFTSAVQNPTITNSTTLNSGTYTVTVSNSSCSATATALVTVNSTPSTNAGSDVNITIGSSTTLTATGGTSYIWTPTSGLDCDTCANPVATPTATTIYCVQSAIGSCNSSDCVTITIETPCPSNKDLAVPNAFSPNADGHNDDFCLQGWNACIETFTILIYDRWGEKVFESEEANFCWDGMYRGKIMDPAVFVYYIKATFTNDEKVVKKGNVSLIK